MMESFKLTNWAKVNQVIIDRPNKQHPYSDKLVAKRYKYMGFAGGPSGITEEDRINIDNGRSKFVPLVLKVIDIFQPKNTGDQGYLLLMDKHNYRILASYRSAAKFNWQILINQLINIYSYMTFSFYYEESCSPLFEANDYRRQLELYKFDQCDSKMTSWRRTISSKTGQESIPNLSSGSETLELRSHDDRLTNKYQRYNKVVSGQPLIFAVENIFLKIENKLDKISYRDQFALNYLWLRDKHDRNILAIYKEDLHPHIVGFVIMITSYDIYYAEDNWLNQEELYIDKFEVLVPIFSQGNLNISRVKSKSFPDNYSDSTKEALIHKNFKLADRLHELGYRFKGPSPVFSLTAMKWAHQHGYTFSEYSLYWILQRDIHDDGRLKRIRYLYEVIGRPPLTTDQLARVHSPSVQRIRDYLIDYIPEEEFEAAMDYLALTNSLSQIKILINRGGIFTQQHFKQALKIARAHQIEDYCRLVNVSLEDSFSVAFAPDNVINDYKLDTDVLKILEMYIEKLGEQKVCQLIKQYEVWKVAERMDSDNKFSSVLNQLLDK